MSRSVSIDAMNKISYCLAYHSFLFYISKLLFVTVILYFCIHFHLAPVEGLFFKPKYRANILCICFNFIAVLFLFLSSPWGSVYRFLHITWSMAAILRDSVVVVVVVRTRPRAIPLAMITMRVSLDFHIRDAYGAPLGAAG